MTTRDRDQPPQNTRHDPARRGRALTTERALYFALVDQGVGYREAARRAGVNYRLTKTWRATQRAHTAAADAATAAAAEPVAISPRFLTIAERIVIADRRHTGASIRAIARELGRPASTISREITRNSPPEGGSYQPYAADRRAAVRRARPKTPTLIADPVLRGIVQGWLDQRWSPQQITHRLCREYPDRPEWHMTHETLYQALYLQARGGLRREVTGWLRSGRAQRIPRTRPDTRRPRMATDMLMISERPPEVADRAVPGHWEGDLIMGASNRSAIVTLVERTTRFVLLVFLPDGHGAVAVRDALATAIATLPEQLRRSLTWDQGSEMHLHHQITLATDLPIYFCDPHSPWQRGSNENTNGLLRQYFPKGTDLSVHTAEHLAFVAAQLNGRPRQTLGWDTPAERLAKLLAAS
jgi:transposase, IS30 family